MEDIYRVVTVHRDRYSVRKEADELYCVLAGNLRFRDEFPVVGDYVKITVNPFGDSLIREICPRRTVFCRPDRSGHADGYVKTMQVQPLISNIDYVFIITSLNNDFSVSRIARYAATAVSGGAIPVAVLTKADICTNTKEFEAQVSALSEHIEVLSVSSYTGMGIERLQKYFTPGTTIALLGSSGAGKSTLINRLAGREIMRTGNIREEDSKGRHTTTHRELIELNGVSIIDTPGLRELGMIDAEAGIADTFSDITTLTCQCAFSNCTHRTERGCAILGALADGRLSAERWEMYSRLEQENSWSSTRKHEKMVNIALTRRAVKSKKGF